MARTTKKPEKAYAKEAKILRIRWKVSDIGCPWSMRQTVRGLGLRRLHHIVEREDTPSIRGMIHRVRHLVEVVKEKA
jgi:large subunit ribosomal protein L30